jgi:hypothetical protein
MLAINGYGNFAWEEFKNISLVFIMGFFFEVFFNDDIFGKEGS